VPWRFSGASAVTLHDMDTTVAEIAHAHENGLRAIHLSGDVGLIAPDLPPFNDRYYEPMWAALDERAMALVFHPGVGREKPLLVWEGSEPGWEGIRFRQVKQGHRDALPYLLLAGIPERYPNLRIGYVESHSTWIPPLLEELDSLVRNQKPDASIRLNLMPSEQFRRQGFAAGPLKPEEVAARHALGVGNLMWGSDFPHPEGTSPHSRENIEELFRDIPEPETAAMIGGNAARFLGFDLAKLAETPAARTAERVGV
jgi:predicted TIM-barrel fold metal-dependent hydrolase